MSAIAAVSPRRMRAHTSITQDQASVYFTAMMVYSVFNEQEGTIKNVAFKSVTEQDLVTALVRSVEGSTSACIALSGLGDPSTARIGEEAGDEVVV